LRNMFKNSKNEGVSCRLLDFSKAVP